ncbi:hypothetical protein AVEN_123148-1 [Araneus ventricosus]|uniref:Uncharacterized protein n=1 Tax=Araneus ventricosus TaxID=182803 RepID=A0A4Y2U794_ARAVE|nr:hypothetical protein AVEN_123148-1 [Araneus ventricosus]
MNGFNIFRDLLQNISRLSARWTHVWTKYTCMDKVHMYGQRLCQNPSEVSRTTGQLWSVKVLKQYQSSFALSQCTSTTSGHLIASPHSHLDRIYQTSGRAITRGRYRFF